MRIAVTGSTALLGGGLVERLRADGHRIHRVVRDRAAATGDDIYWSVERAEIDAAAFEGVDAVFHFAGEPFGNRRWTEEQKARLHDSRVEGTHLLARTLAELADPPEVLLSASAVGYYGGDHGDELLTEASPPGADFLARLCVAWEQAASPAADAGIRVVNLRTGVVIAEDGPLIEKVRLPFKLGVGGRIGDGQQWVPWIALEDHLRSLEFLLHSDLEGPFNLTAPEPVRNAELTEAIGNVLHRPTLLPVPLAGIRLLYGEMGVTLASSSQRVVPQRLLDAGFEFRVTDLRAALRHALT